jgi:(p)ppGpp synthase/HD superfamily hydrolase
VYHELVNTERIERAATFARKAHAGQVRKFGGGDYIVHPERVARRVAALEGATEVMVVAGWLHDVVEDTPVTADTIAEEFGPDVAGLVLELTKVGQDEELTRAEKHSANLAALALISSPAKRIKMCDRIDNLHDMRGAPTEFIQRYLPESRNLLAVLRVADEVLGRELEALIDELSEELLTDGQ